MSQEALRGFCRQVFGDPSLEEPLRQAADRLAFTALLVRLARERGLGVSESDVEEALVERRREWNARWI